MNTMTATPACRSHIVIISLLLACSELMLISPVLSVASIDHGTSNTSHQQKHSQQELSREQESGRGRNQPTENQLHESTPQHVEVKQEFIIYSGVYAEDQQPYFKLKCPIVDCITRRPVASQYNDEFIKRKFKSVKDKIKVKWFKDHEPFQSRANGNRLDEKPDGTRILYQPGASDEGHYKCVIDYSNVPVELSKYFEFTIGAEFDVYLRDTLPDLRPTITHPPDQKFASIGANVTFTCNRTDTLSAQSTRWFKSCPFQDTICIERFMAAFNRSVDLQNEGPLMTYMIRDAFEHDWLHIKNVTEAKTGYYGCVVANNLGIDIRLGRLDLLDNWAKSQLELNMQSSKQSDPVEAVPWAWVAIGMAAFFFMAVAVVGCVYLFKISVQRDEKQSSHLINTVVGKEPPDPRARLPNIEAPDIYNTGKSVDGFITGHFHQATGHLMAQSICSNLLDKATPSISSANSQQSDEASSSWGKSSGDNFKAFYTPASNTTATTVPLYDHPPSTGTLGHCNSFVHGACINNPTYGFLRSEADEWTFPRRNLDRLDKIGEGQFGEVWRYVARQRNGNDDIVAVKQLKPHIGFGDGERLELMAEIEIMKSVNHHPNVIKLLHYCVDEYGPILLIMEYAENGKLQTYLRKCREPRKTYLCSGESKSTPSITSKELLKFTYHIAKGMEYVASQGIVHRDLASRNILVSRDRVCKVADFGFARRVNDECAYERTSTNPVPVKWMAPEALVGNKFTSKSDVFSLGILMWEIVTLGATPYEQLTSEGVYKKVTTGGRLERPPHCKDEFFDLMAKCWTHDPVQRPSFKEVANQLEKLLLSENDYIELDQYPEHAYYNILNTAEKEVVNLAT